MKNVNSHPINIVEDDDMLPEYDVAKMPGGVRGKYAAAYREGHSVVIHHEDGAVLLDPDVRKFFPDSEAVNAALRDLIPLLERRAA